MAFTWQWLRGNFDDPIETNTFAALKIILNGQTATRLYDHFSGGERDFINIALFPLAKCFAENWWTLLYEPRKSLEEDSLVSIRHSLDAYLNGFVFPPLTLWSGGDDAIIFERPNIRQEISSLEFLQTGDRSGSLPRVEVEGDIFRLINSVIDRLPKRDDTLPLRQAWDRVCTSLEDEGEREYCVAAGRLGIDPYDPEAVDITDLTDGLSERLFSNICEAVTPHELKPATDWARESTDSLHTFPEIDVSALGAIMVRDPQTPIWEHGYHVARTLRQNLGLNETTPRHAVDRLFGAAVRGHAAVIGPHPFALEAIAGRINGGMRVAVPKVSARLRRSTLCRAFYLAGRTLDGDASAVTTAGTLDQQASRAFAAELLTPAEWLRDRAGPNGLTEDDIETIANENVCPQTTIIWHAYNNRIPLRGVALPRMYSM
jgi:hypothetical protein